MEMLMAWLEAGADITRHMFSMIKSQDSGDFEPTSPKILDGKPYTIPSAFLTLSPGNVATRDTRSSA